MKRILFVDDEPRLLEGLQRMLRPQRKQWEMTFAGSGAEALAMIAAQPFDVIVTDMRMPGMDGAELLQRVRELSPSIVRIVLSGYFERDAALRSVPVAHQFLAKPCDPEKLREAIERACAFSAMLPDEALRHVVGAIGELPALPRTSALLLQCLDNPDTPMDEIGRIVEQDVGITAKVLQLVNSAFFGRTQPISTVLMAVSCLGLDTLKHLVISAAVFRTFSPARTIRGFSLQGVENQSRLAARIAARLPGVKGTTSPAAVSTLLHDVGQLILAARLPEEFELALKISKEEGRPLYLVEEELSGASHAEIGAYLLGLWGIPSVIVDAVCRHHRPQLTSDSGLWLDVAAVTHIADALASESLDALEDSTSPCRNLLNLDYITWLGVADEVPGWRAMAAELAMSQKGAR